jgi:hypothetical protein
VPPVGRRRTGRRQGGFRSSFPLVRRGAPLVAVAGAGGRRNRLNVEFEPAYRCKSLI